MSENENHTTGMFDNFIHPCLTCGTTVHVVSGQAQAHECGVLPESERVAYAWWQGHDAAKASVERERDEVAERLSALLCDLTGGRLSKPTYDVRTMVQAIEEFMGEQLEADAEARAEKAEATLARVRALAAEHAECSGCRTPWWLTAAFEGGDDE